MPADPHRSLYLVAYDISHPKRLARVLRYMKGWKAGGQKSFCECYLTPAECRRTARDLQDLIDPQEDRVHIIALDPRMEPFLYGTARLAPEFFCIV